MYDSISLCSNKGIRNWLRLISPITNTVGKLVLRGPWQQSANGTIRHHAHPLLSVETTHSHPKRSCCHSYLKRHGGCIVETKERERPRDRFSGQWARGLSRSKTLKTGWPKYIFSVLLADTPTFTQFCLVLKPNHCGFKISWTLIRIRKEKDSFSISIPLHNLVQLLVLGLSGAIWRVTSFGERLPSESIHGLSSDQVIPFNLAQWCY